MRYLACLQLLLPCVFIGCSLAAGGELVEIVPPDFADARQPQVTIGDDLWIRVAFGSGDSIFTCVSKDLGRTFERPTKVGTLPGLALGMRRGPRIACDGRKVTVTAMNDDLFAFHSDDGGLTWTSPDRINDVDASAREGLHALAQGPGGRIFVTWLDLRSGQMEVYGAMSEDAGNSWSENKLVYRSPDEHVCECCHPSVVFNADGDVVVMWRNWLDGSRDMWAAVMPAGAQAFEAPRKQGAGNWMINGCPMDGGAVFALADGSFGSVWRREKSVYLSAGPKQEQMLGEGVQPFAVESRGLVNVFWNDGTKLMHLSDQRGARPGLIASNASYGAAAVLPDSKGVVVVFESVVDGRNSISALVMP